MGNELVPGVGRTYTVQVAVLMTSRVPVLLDCVTDDARHGGLNNAT